MDATTVDAGGQGGETTRWRDRKLLFWPLALVVPLIPLRSVALAEQDAHPLLWFLAPIVVFLVFPIVDTLAGLDRRNPPESEVPRLETRRYYRWVTYAYIPLQYLSLVVACGLWAGGELRWWESLGLATGVGLVGGIAINTAHELGHKRPAVERWLSKVALAQTAYGHFQLEHNRGHHTRVSTPDDPASARMGESFYWFLPRTVLGSLRSALRLERERERRLGQRFWSPRNELLNAWAMTVVLFGGLVAWFGWSIAPWLALQAVLGFSLLEVVNYIEHYGLLRRRGPDGRYERCRPEHSWNASNVVSNLLLFQLQRHSDHHAFPTRRYQVLRHYEDVPQLPTGYAGMIVLAAIPPLWRRVMDPRVIDFYGGDVTRANLHPRQRARLVARYGAPAAAA
ncbi:MAG: alkane 1-monooxygenase [Acidimicrobiia bacterium]